MKAVRELGSERRETVRSISGVSVGALKDSSIVREDLEEHTSGIPVITPVVNAG